MKNIILIVLGFALGYSTNYYLNRDTLNHSSKNEPQLSQFAAETKLQECEATLAKNKAETESRLKATNESLNKNVVNDSKHTESKKEEKSVSQAEESAREFSKKIEKTKNQPPTLSPKYKELSEKIIADNRYLVGVAFDKNQPEIALKRLNENLDKMPSNTDTIGRIVQVLNSTNRHAEAKTYCEKGISYTLNSYSPENFGLASNCSDTYYALQEYQKAIKCSMYCYEYGIKDQNNYLQQIHSYKLALSFERINDKAAFAKYSSIACKLGEPKACSN